MKFLVDATTPPKDKQPYIKSLAWMLAAILLIMAVAQLFAFEKFVPLVESFWLPGGRPAAYLVATLIVVGEVLALPYLLGMRLSPAMRAVSAGSMVIALVLWLYIALWLNVTTNAVSNIGLLGTKVPLMTGWWVVFFVAALIVLAIWILWGRPIVTTAKGRSKGDRRKGRAK